MLPRIQTALRQLEATHGIRILYACESGSRAWGFPSLDSDYDVRFIYCHSPAWYLALDEGPDTLNFPVDDELDLAGWELRKALRLLRGSNASVFEWLQSPIVYHEALDFRARLAPLLPAAFNLKAGLHHYLGQLRRGVEEDLTGPDVRLKRLFYALRSALAARPVTAVPVQLERPASDGRRDRPAAVAGPTYPHRRTCWLGGASGRRRLGIRHRSVGRSDKRASRRSAAASVVRTCRTDVLDSQPSGPHVTVLALTMSIAVKLPVGAS